jgi:hypothetical protein
MSASKSWLTAAFAGALIWLSGSANPLAAEDATAIAPPAARFAALNACRIVSPTFAPDAPSHGVIEVRYSGGGKLSFAVATPCPERVVAFDV